MTALNKQALREAAQKATPGRIGDRIDHKNMEYGFIGDNGNADELFFRLCVPDVILTLLDELESAYELIELQRFNLERQAEDLHQAKSLESIHRDKRYEIEREFRDYKERAESNQMRLAKEVCRLEDELQAAGISVKGE